MYDTAADAFVVSGCVMRNVFCVIPCVRNVLRDSMRAERFA